MNASEKKTDMVELNCEEMERAAGGGLGESGIQKKESPEVIRDVYNYCPTCKMNTLVRYTNTGTCVCSVCGNVFRQPL